MVWRRTLPGFQEQVEQLVAAGDLSLADFESLEAGARATFNQLHKRPELSNPFHPDDAAAIAQQLTWMYASAALRYQGVFGLKQDSLVWALWPHYCYQADQLEDPRLMMDLLECRR
jgi:hypothetical protein